ncbi:hypothetical protein GGR56DRAFT_285574 [Xylariaceae sp. FL0804]|nr:hypothetical protein GGR56DRAFT_285574 [Xylariaceae sp. FL0804]
MKRPTSDGLEAVYAAVWGLAVTTFPTLEACYSGLTDPVGRALTAAKSRRDGTRTGLCGSASVTGPGPAAADWAGLVPGHSRVRPSLTPYPRRVGGSDTLPYPYLPAQAALDEDLRNDRNMASLGGTMAIVNDDSTNSSINREGYREKVGELGG